MEAAEKAAQDANKKAKEFEEKNGNQDAVLFSDFAQK